jgi:hypothetical protein
MIVSPSCLNDMVRKVEKNKVMKMKRKEYR